MLWNLENPLKTKICICLALAKKTLTWDNGYKRNWFDPRRFIICKEENETMDHLSVKYMLTKVVWKEILQSLNLRIL